MEFQQALFGTEQMLKSYYSHNTTRLHLNKDIDFLDF